jgi:hypothetical protein
MNLEFTDQRPESVDRVIGQAKALQRVHLALDPLNQYLDIAQYCMISPGFPG